MPPCTAQTGGGLISRSGWGSLEKQRAEKKISARLDKNRANSLGLVDFPVRQADFIGHLPNER